MRNWGEITRFIGVLTPFVPTRGPALYGLVGLGGGDSVQGNGHVFFKTFLPDKYYNIPRKSKEHL